MKEIHFSCSYQVFHCIECIFNVMKHDKEKGIFDSDDPKWLNMFGQKALGTFWWPTKEEAEEHLALRYSLPVEERKNDPRLKKPWHFPSMLEAIKEGEYALVDCIFDQHANTGSLLFDPFSYPFGGDEALKVFLSSLGAKVLE